MSIPTKGECYSRLTEYLRRAQEEAAMLAHLSNADGDAGGRVVALGWLKIEDQLKKFIHTITHLATRGIQ